MRTGFRRQRPLSSFMKLLAAALLVSCLSLTDAKNLRASRALQTTFTETFDVNLTLALHFVDDSTATALETKDKSNAVVDFFCDKVQEQALGQQVVFAGEEVDVSILPAGSGNKCTVIDAVRAYDTGGELLGAGFFTIQVLVSQTVNTVSQEALTNETVTGLVENGYNRGRGGRVRFRTILQESTAFANVLDVDVLDELGAFMEAPSQAPTTATTAPTMEPTVAPTTSPSSVPSVVPSNEPSTSPSLVPSSIPSASPSTTSPTPEPSIIPTGSPSLAPSVYKMAGIVPTLSNDQPSSSPSLAPTLGEAAAATPSKTPPYVIACIVVSSWAILMACCFSLFLCRKHKKANDEQQLLHNGRPSEDSTPPLRSANQENLSQDLSTLPIVPNVVLADDDHRSLANTTLGEQTAGRKPPKKKRLVDTGVSINSFDDESLYTTPIGIIPRIQPGRRIDEDENDDKKRKSTSSPPPTLGVSSAFGSDIFFPSDTGSSSQESWAMPQSPVASKIGGLVAAELGPVAGDDPEALPSEQGSQYTESRDDVDGMNGNSLWSPQQLSPRSSQSSMFSSLHSSDTVKAQNVAATIALTTHQKTSDEQHTVDAPGTYQRSGSSSLLMRKKLGDDSFASEKDAATKTPMKLMETHKEESTVAVMEEQSPMQMLEEEDNKTDVSPIDLQDSDSANDLQPSSSGERPPRTKTSGQTGTAPRTPTDVTREGRTARRSVSPYKARYLEGLHSPAAQLELEKALSSGSQRTPSPLAKDTRREPVTLSGDSSWQSQTVTPPSDLLPSMYNVRQGDGARQNAIESPPPAPLTEGDMSILTTSSSGTSTDDNPWLFESVTRALGPRSTSADMESLSGKSVKSTKSGKSWRSHRSTKSLGNRQRRKRRKGGSIGSRGSQRTSFSFGSPRDYKSSSDFSLAPRSLENDLKRLEQQLASLKSTDPKKQPDRVPLSPPGLTGTSSSITASDMSSHRKVSTKQKIIVVAPPGKLGVVLANRHKYGTGTVVSEVRGSSPLRGALFPGDKLLAVDERDVTGLNVSQITTFMAKRGSRERRLTVITSSKARARAAKYALQPAGYGSTTASESEGSP